MLKELMRDKYVSKMYKKLYIWSSRTRSCLQWLVPCKLHHSFYGRMLEDTSSVKALYIYHKGMWFYYGLNISFTCNRYYEEVCCDVLPRDFCLLCLGAHWFEINRISNKKKWPKKVVDQWDNISLNPSSLIIKKRWALTPSPKNER